MYAMNRVNRMGLKFTMVEIDPYRTEIKCGEKSITVNINIHKLSQSWYDWTQIGRSIQVAFDYLTADEREFLMTAMTRDEWNVMMEQEEN